MDTTMFFNDLAESLRGYLAPKEYESHPESDEPQEVTAFLVVPEGDHVRVEIDALIGDRSFELEVVLWLEDLSFQGHDIDWLAKGIALDIDEVFNAGSGIPLSLEPGRRHRLHLS